MRRRLTIALVGVALASVLLVGAGVLILAQIGARAQATDDAREQVDLLVDFATFELTSAADGRRRPGAQPLLERLGPAVGFVDASLAVVTPNGSVSTIDGFAIGESDRPGRRLTPLVDLDEEQLATLVAGEAVVLDGGALGDDTAFRDASGDVIVLQAVVSPSEQAAAPGDRALAIVARQPVVTVGREARAWFVVSAGAVLAGAAIASIVLARRFSKPVKDIEQVTAAVAAGDFTARVQVDGDDEVAQLGGSVNRMAAELERSKALDQQFLMSVSHDLRTPLTAITGYGEALRDGAVEDPRVAGDVIGNQAARLERLVGDLLDLARLDANRFQLDTHVADVAVIVGRTVAGLQPRAEAAGLDCRFVNDGPATASVDADRLAQAIGNLIDNAIKFATSTIVVRVALDGADVVVTVADDGPGIAADDLPHVFERLYVAKHQPIRAESSSGLGLAIVREIVTAMGGTVQADARPGSGTVMTVRLPLS